MRLRSQSPRFVTSLSATKTAAVAGLCLSLVLTTLSPGPATGRERVASAKAVVKPGAKVLFSDTYCTMNFVFKGSDGYKYLGTAGHCPLDDEKTIVWKPGKGIPAQDASGVPIGKFAFAVYSEANNYDFALVRLHPNIRPDPQMTFYGGPTRLNGEITSEPEFVNIYGHGIVAGDVSPQRQLLAPNGFDDSQTLITTGVASPGDSGAPVTSAEDEALGVVVAGGVFVREPSNGAPYPGVVEIVRLSYNLSYAQRELGIRLKLMKASPL